MKKEKINFILKELKKILKKEGMNKIINSYKRGKVKEYLTYLNTNQKEKFSRFDIYRWERGIVPDAIKTIISIYENKFHKINKIVLARLLGWGFGDGGVNKDNPRYYFICGKKEDLIHIKNYLKKNINNIKPSIKENNSEGIIEKRDGTIKYLKGRRKTFILYIKNSTFARFLYGIGLSKGKKVLQKFNLPEWIKKGSKKVKKEFLNAIFECEGEKSSLYRTKTKIILKSPIFSLNKKVEYKINLISFLNEIIELFSELGIKCKLDPKIKEGNKRKDGNITCSIRFWVNNSSINLIKFSRVINYRFNKEKRQLLKETVKECKNKIKRINNQKKKYNQAKKMYNKGILKSKIAKNLDLSHPTISGWINGKIQPRLIETNLEEFL